MTKRDWYGEFFKAEDNCGATIRFEEVNGEIERIPTPLITIEKANAILRSEIEKLETVFGHITKVHEGDYTVWSGMKDWQRVNSHVPDTHQTKILPPKEIEK